MVDCQTASDVNVAMFGKNYDNKGCNGGRPDKCWNFVKDWGALADKEYPYEMSNWDGSQKPSNACKRAANDHRIMVPQKTVSGWDRA